jgi:hypothetical protein
MDQCREYAKSPMAAINSKANAILVVSSGVSIGTRFLRGRVYLVSILGTSAGPPLRDGPSSVTCKSPNEIYDPRNNLSLVLPLHHYKHQTPKRSSIWKDQTKILRGLMNPLLDFRSTFLKTASNIPFILSTPRRSRLKNFLRNWKL